MMEMNGKECRFGWRQRLQVVVGVGRALAHLHAQTPPMIHRDVKSQNVLLTHHPSTPNVNILAATKVADFGTVRADVRHRKLSGQATATGNQADHASTRMVIGTMPYMPNEYVMQGHVSEKTDAFAFGILLIGTV